MTADGSDIITTLEDGIATVTLNRPAKKNAMTMEMFEALPRACDAVSGARAVILAGAGGSFSAGLDLGLMMSFGADIAAVKARLAEADADGANVFQRPVTCWASLGVPVIAAVEGVCFGAGLQLALGADFRIVAPDARLSIMEARWGLIPDMGITRSLPALMPADRAKMLIMTGRELSGTEAVMEGLATEVSEAPLDRARCLAEELATRAPEALAASKALVETAWRHEPDRLSLEAEFQTGLMGSPNQLEAVMANIQKRTPRFNGA